MKLYSQFIFLIICQLKIAQKILTKEDFFLKIEYATYMRKILIIITSVIILLGMYIYFFILQKDNKWEISYNTGSVESTVSYEQMKEKMIEENTKNAELYNTAIKDGNLSLCDGLSSENKKIECRDNIQITTIQKS